MNSGRVSPPRGDGRSVIPGPNDVLLGRGSGVQYHPGNIAFRQHVETRKEEYVQTSSGKNTKNKIAQEVVDHIRLEVDPPGKFLRQAANGLWEEVDDETAFEKVKQALRQQKKSRSAQGQNQPKECQREETDLVPSATIHDSELPSITRGVDKSAEEIEEDLRQMTFELDGVVPAEPRDTSAGHARGGAGVADEECVVNGNAPMHEGYFDRLRSVQNDNRLNETGRRLLAVPDDHKFLSTKLCLVRSQIEVFEATEDDVEARQRKGGKNKQIVVGQVGLRCIHCAHIPPSLRSSGASFYPESVRLVHQAVRNWQRYHLGNCEHMPSGLLEQLNSRKSSRSHSGAVSLQYWVNSSKSLGMVDELVEGGVRLRRSLDNEVALMEPSAVDDTEGKTAPRSSSSAANHEVLSASDEIGLVQGDSSILGQPDGASDTIHLDLVVSAQSAQNETASNATSLTSASTSFLPHSRESNSLEEPPQDKRQHMLDRVQLAYDIVRSTHHIRGVALSSSANGISEQRSDSRQTAEDLFALGVGLYEWFAGCHPFEGNGNGSISNYPSSTSSIGLDSRGNDADAPQPEKKRGTRSGNKAYRPLRELGFPMSLCSLVSNLLDANVASSCTLARYASAHEVEEDLRLMMADPDRFLFGARMETATGKLEFPCDRLYGREKEIGMLLDVYDRAIESNQACEVVMVTGHSGTGKSSLVHLVKGLLEEKGGYFASGKFDKLRQAQPLSAVVAAFNEYCDILLTRDVSEMEETRMAIQHAIGSDGKVLTDLIPSLAKVIGPQPEVVAVGGKEAGNRLTFVFRAFVRAIAVASHPLIIFLDDLQWADEASLELITSLVTDPNLSSLLFLGCYRDNEVGDDHPLCSQIRCIESTGTGVSSIRIGNIDRDSVNALISDTLCLLPRLTLELADVVFSKTSGNGLFVVQFLKSLCDEGLLRFSLSSRRWEWDFEGIQSKEVADNVAELMTEKMQRLSMDVQGVLMTAACLGARTETLTFELLSASDGSSLIPLLSIAVSEGLIYKLGSSFKFSHDQIQQAAYSLIPVCERGAWHLRIGRLLWKNASDDELDKVIFSVVDQLCRGSDLISDHSEKVEFARLCLLAGEKSVSKSSFFSAAVYLLQGTVLLNESDWEHHYGLCLRLFSSCAEAQYANGNYDAVTITSNPILQHCACLQDKLRAYHALINSLGSQGKQLDAIKLGLDVLAGLGESFPSEIKRTDVLKDFTKTRAMLEATTVKGILQMDVLEDTKVVAIIKILSVLARHAYKANQPLMSLMTFRTVQLSLRHGLCRESTIAFALFGLVLCNFGELEEGYYFGKLALSILERFNAKECLARVYGFVYGLINTATEPWQACLAPQKYGYEVGMSTGDIEIAMTNAQLCITFGLQSGSQLGTLAAETRVFTRQMQEYKHHTLLLALPCYQAILNLMGKSEDPTVLTGEAMSQEQLDSALECGSTTHVANMIYFLRMWLAYLFRRNDLAAEMAERRRQTTRARLLRGPMTVNESFFTGLIAVGVAREGENNEWRKVALAETLNMKTWAANSSWNFQHKLDLLNAEIAANLDGDFDGAAKAYDDSIHNARLHRFVNEEALACERAGIFHSSVGNAERASRYFAQAHKCYLEWGATRKADHLVELGSVDANDTSGCSWVD